MTSIEQKNTNILNRFENNKTGTKIRVFNVTTKCGKGAVMISMHGADDDEAATACKEVFGDNFKTVKARS